VNLDGFVHIQVVATGDPDGTGADGWGLDDGRWVLEGILRDRSSARLLEGSRAECQALLEEVAQAVWAIGVGVTVSGDLWRPPPGGSAAELKGLGGGRRHVLLDRFQAARFRRVGPEHGRHA